MRKIFLAVFVVATILALMSGATYFGISPNPQKAGPLVPQIFWTSATLSVISLIALFSRLAR